MLGVGETMYFVVSAVGHDGLGELVKGNATAHTRVADQVPCGLPEKRAGL